MYRIDRLSQRTRNLHMVSDEEPISEFRPEEQIYKANGDDTVSKTSRRAEARRPLRPSESIPDNVYKAEDLVTEGIVQRGRFAMMGTLSKLHEGFKEFKKSPISHIRGVLPSPATVASTLRSVGLSTLGAAQNVLMNIHSSALIQHAGTEFTAIAAGATLIGTSGYQLAVHTFGMVKTFKGVYDVRKEMNQIHDAATDPQTGKVEYTKEQLLRLDELFTEKVELKGKISKLIVSDAPKLFLDIAGGSLMLTASVGKLIGVVGQAALPVLMTAVHVLGYIGAGIGFVLGVWGLQKSVRGLYSDWKAHRAINQRRKNLDANFEVLTKSLGDIKDVRVDQLKILEELRLDQDVIKKNRAFSLHVFGFSLSTMAIAGAALGIAAAASHGGALIGLAVAGLVLSGISIGVQVASFVHSRHLTKKIEQKKQELAEKLEGDTPADFIIKLGDEIKKMTPEQVETLASYFGVGASTLQSNPETVLATIYADLLPKRKR